MSQDNALSRVGFIGLGAMGVGMAKNVVENGFALTILGRANRAPVERLVALGAHEVRTPAEVARNAEVVILCVTTSAVVEELVFGDDGLLAGAEHPLIVIDCGTSDPNSTLRIGAALRERGGDMIDAPLGRTPVEAETGQLNIMAGGDPDTYAKVLPVLQAMGENVFHVGELGVGHKLKLINNFYAQSVACLVAEAVATSRKVGVEVDKLYEVMAAGPSRSPFFDWMFAQALRDDPSGLRFALKNAHKDVGYFVGMAESAGIPCVMAPAAERMLALALEGGYGEEPVPRLIRFFEGYSAK